MAEKVKKEKTHRPKRISKTNNSFYWANNFSTF